MAMPSWSPDAALAHCDEMIRAVGLSRVRAYAHLRAEVLHGPVLCSKDRVIYPREHCGVMVVTWPPTGTGEVLSEH